ncbi:MAG TPA: ABC transporter substrate-binding protein [Kiritimatiellia bacterium]|nr:ABC transporter substrate-binding protein [Kiritimatiellia bacterium]
MATKLARFALLRGVCQTPAYVAHARGLFAEEGVESSVHVSPTAWMIPEQLLSGSVEFAVISWTRVAAAEKGEAPLKLLCGSGIEEAAIVVREGLDPAEVRTVAVPREGGMKDLTAMGLLESMGWSGAVQRRFPSGDGAIISFFGQGADAASMVEPYAAMMEQLGVGRVVRRTGDVWPGAPGCTLAASAALIERDPDLVQRVVRAYVKAIAHVRAKPDDAAAAAAPLIGVHEDMIRRALRSNLPDANAIRNEDSMQRILQLMQRLGYVAEIPSNFSDLRFLDQVQAVPAG